MHTFVVTFAVHTNQNQRNSLCDFFFDRKPKNNSFFCTEILVGIIIFTGILRNHTGLGRTRHFVTPLWFLKMYYECIRSFLCVVRFQIGFRNIHVHCHQHNLIPDLGFH